MSIFYMMVGLPGSGKSYSIPNYLGHYAVHSSDAIREELLGDSTDQSQQSLVFDTLHKRVFDDLRAGKDVIYDATNISYKRRREFLQQLDRQGIQCFKTCIFMATPYEICLKNNASRERHVPESVIRQMYEHFDIPMMCEGWDAIQIKDYYLSPCNMVDMIRRISSLEHDNPHHKFTVGQHCLVAQAYMYGHYPDSDAVLRTAALLHDIGKESTKVFNDSHGNPTNIAHYYNHERTGAYDSFLYTIDMGLSDIERLKVALLIRWHMYPFAIEKSENPDKTKNKLVSLIGENLYNEILILHDCDIHAH